MYTFVSILVLTLFVNTVNSVNGIGYKTEWRLRGYMMKRYYMTCPDCHTRMVRTGKKEKEYRIEGQLVYRREYGCKNCGTTRIHSESRNYFVEGSL